MSALRFVVFFAVLVAVLSALNFFVYRWASSTFLRRRNARRWLAVLLWGSVLGMVLARVGARVWSGMPSGPLLLVSSMVQLTVILSAFLLLPVTLAGSVVEFAQRLRRGPGVTRPGRPLPAQVAERSASADAQQGPSTPHPGFDSGRRSLLRQAGAGSAFLIASSSSLYGALHGRVDYAIEEVPLRIPGLARALDGFTIVQLSDIHIGQFVGEAELRVAAELVAKAKPDLIVLTGDLLDNDPLLAPRLGTFARRLGPLARHGVVAISGNHDFFAGIRPFEASLRKGGAVVLQNEARVFGERSAGFALLGVEDVWAERQGGGPDLRRAVESLPALGGSVAAARALPRLLLCHNPVFFEHAAGKVAAQLSGHTHGGQINLLLRPADWVLKNGWVAGRYHLAGSELYINRGFGTVGPPARLGAPPEVSRIVLVS